MSTEERLAEWITDQLQLISDGLPIKFIRVEGQDDVIWSTLPVKDDDEPDELKEKLQRIVKNIEPGLHVGRHVLRIVACNSEGHPTSVLQYVVNGAAPPTKRTAAIDDSLGRMASTLAELVDRTARTVNEMNEKVSAAMVEQFEGNVKLQELVLMTQHDMYELKTNARKDEMKMQMLSSLGEQGVPALVMGIGELVGWLATKRKNEEAMAAYLHEKGILKGKLPNATAMMEAMKHLGETTQNDNPDGETTSESTSGGNGES